MLRFERPTDQEVALYGKENSARSPIRSDFVRIRENGMVLKNKYDASLNFIKCSRAISTGTDETTIYRIDPWEYNQDLFTPISTLYVSLKNMRGEIDYEDAEIMIRDALEGFPIYLNQTLAAEFKDAKAGLAAIVIQNLGEGIPCGRVTVDTIIDIECKYLTISEHVRLRKAFDPAKWDFKTSEIGGLNSEVFEILRRAFLSRLMNPQLRERLGLRHVKGMLLYGPPGTGKTLIARKIGKMMGMKENDPRVKIVNGPELFSKWVGESERQLRELFVTQSKELHILIFDEIESSARKRDSGSNDVNGKFVTQFLALLDGVTTQDNIFVIGMTNRKDLIDPAMIRPGRLEILIEINLPSEAGRYEILQIHTAHLREEGMLSEDVNLSDLAKQTRNFTGAEIEGLIKSAVSFATTRQLKDRDIGSVDTLLINQCDIDLALEEIVPAFGKAQEDLIKYMRYGILDQNHPGRVVNYIDSLSENTVTKILVHGDHGCGCTAWAAYTVQNSTFDFVKFIKPFDYVEMSETATVSAITQMVRDSHRSKSSLIVIDDLENFIRLTTMGGLSMSRFILSSLQSLFGENPPFGHKWVLMATTHESPDLWADFNFTRTFELELVDGKPVKQVCMQ